MRNKGWEKVEYSFGDDLELNERMSELINTFCHVFWAHADDNWKTEYKPKFVKLLAVEIRQNPSLIRKLKELKDPVVSNVTYAAIEYNENVDDENA